MKPVTSLKKYHTQSTPNWCPGCGNFGIWVSLKNAITNLSIPAHNVVIVGDIGCSGKLAYWTEVNGFATLHGRSIPVAEGIKMANHRLTVIVVAGDGGTLSEGLQHFLHACRRNVDITVLMHNNQLYGLTKGQASSTSEKGYVSSTTPHGSFETPLNPALLALSSQATFVAASFAGNAKHLTRIIEQAISHRGFAYVDAYQPCVTYNYINTYAFYSERTYELGADYDATNRQQAMITAMEIDSGERFPIGVMYQEENVKTLEDNVLTLEEPLAHRDISDVSVDVLFKK
jgi:2-oxoglutarate ferredoxin oxidoreductase subunit beta